ncbi:MAG: histidine kinase [Hyphomicrobiaceae bacterium]|nr:histidine kinase [Hyphomicrobiaceae bacterium]
MPTTFRLIFGALVLAGAVYGAMLLLAEVPATPEATAIRIAPERFLTPEPANVPGS